MTLPYHTPLSPDQQRALGIDPVQPLAMLDKVRFSELDVLNHVNNKAYMEWFERIRVRYCRDWGLNPDTGGEMRVVIRSGTIHYRREMLMDTDYVVTCGCAAYRNTSFSLRQEIWASGQLCASFDCVMVLLKADGSGRFPIPASVRSTLGVTDGAIFEGT